MTALLWGLAGILLVALGRYEDMPYWFKTGSGASIVLVFIIVSYLRSEE